MSEALLQTMLQGVSRFACVRGDDVWTRCTGRNEWAREHGLWEYREELNWGQQYGEGDGDEYYSHPDEYGADTEAADRHYEHTGGYDERRRVSLTAVGLAEACCVIYRVIHPELLGIRAHSLYLSRLPCRRCCGVSNRSSIFFF